jgi:putative nucleotidyltransferase with HDIG domain
MENFVQKTEEFIKNAFIANPHYSFDHWSVMYNHSIKVKEIALQIAETMHCNKTLVAIGALLHDIGKTYKTDNETLHKDHEKFNLTVSEDFLETLQLPQDDLSQLKLLVSFQSNSVEMQIIKDADALAMYADKHLYTLFIKWAVDNKLETAIKRKVEKFSKLNFDISRQIGEPLLENMRLDWNKYLQEHYTTLMI